MAEKDPSTGRYFYDRPLFELRALAIAKGKKEAAEMREVFPQLQNEGLLRREIWANPENELHFVFVELWLSKDAWIKATKKWGHQRLVELSSTAIALEPVLNQ